MSREAIEDRRQRAREAFHDAPALDLMGAITEAIETATRVKITDEAIDRFTDVYFARDHVDDVRDGLTAALAELGFEVEE